MLGAHTKQVYSYGKRNTRIINVSDDRGYRRVAQEEAVPLRTQTCNKQENIVGRQSPVDVETPQKQVARALSPPAPGLKKPRARHPKPKGNLASKKSAVRLGTPVRTPLSSSSPALLAGAAGKARLQSTPLSANRRFSPFIDVDIIVVDDEGRRLSQEKRVCNTRVKVNPVVSERPGAIRALFAPRETDLIDLCESEDDIPKPTKRSGRGRRRIVVSDDSDDEIAVPSTFGTHPVQKPGKKQVSPPARPIVISSDEFEPEADRTISLDPVTALQSRSSVQPPGRAWRARGGPEPSQPLNPRNASYLPPSPPVVAARPRPLTPIRRGAFPKAPLPPSPATPSSLGLSLDFEGLSLELEPEEAQPACLLPLLEECEQDRPHEFSAFIEMFPFDPLVHSAGGSDDVRFRKIGEASYSEVFGIGEVVLKVIPIRPEAADVLLYSENDGPPPSEARDVLREMIVTRAIGDMCAGFVSLLRRYVVRGRYPSLLLDLWDEYAEKKGSESIRPGSDSLSFCSICWVTNFKCRLLYRVAGVCDHCVAQWGS
jgi:serine/threonine-protein kinase haspin